MSIKHRPSVQAVNCANCAAQISPDKQLKKIKTVVILFTFGTLIVCKAGTLPRWQEVEHSCQTSLVLTKTTEADWRDETGRATGEGTGQGDFDEEKTVRKRNAFWGVMGIKGSFTLLEGFLEEN